MKSFTTQRLILFIFLVGTVWYSFYLIQPPPPRTASSAPSDFSAERAFKHVQQIAGKPHPLGSSANDQVRDYILQELQKLGIKAEIQEGVGVGSSFGLGLSAYVKNIFAKVEGQNPRKTILLMAHYDSAPNAPGAADDASGVATILETLRALKNRKFPLQNNVWVLFTDGEERGLLGAEYFVREFRDIEKIDLVINLEARGSSGPSIMFETSSPNGNLIPHFAEAVPRPVANSLMYTVYKLLPNDTDLSVTKQAGINGLNFAFLDSYLNYHTMQDTPQNLSLASLQHHGSNLLHTLLHFGNLNFDSHGASEYVYFNNAVGGLTFYPASWSLPLAIVCTLLFGAYLIFLVRNRRLSLQAYLGSTLLFTGVVICAAACTYFGWQGLELLHPKYRWLSHGETYNRLWYFAGFSLLNIALFSVVYNNSWIQEKLSIQKQLAGSFTIWILLSLITAWYLPTAAYIFTWPALIALIGWIILGNSIVKNNWKSTAFLAAGSAGVLFMIPPYIYLVEVTLTVQMLVVSMVLLILVLGLVWPIIVRIIKNRSMAWNTGFIVAALSCFFMASAHSGFDSRHKKHNDMNYIQEVNTKQAYWVSRDDTTDSWTKQFLGPGYENGTLSGFAFFNDKELLFRKAKYNELPSPRLKVVKNSSFDTLRSLSIRIDSPTKYIGMVVDWSETAAVRSIHLDGTQVHPSKEVVPDTLNQLAYFKDLSDPITVDFLLNKKKPSPVVSFTFIRMGLPTSLIPNYHERRFDMMPQIGWVTNASLQQISVDPDTLTTTE